MKLCLIVFILFTSLLCVKTSVAQEKRVYSRLQQASLLYHRQYILPVIQSQRSKLEKQLSKEDRDILQNCRFRLNGIYTRSQQANLSRSELVDKTSVSLLQQQASLQLENQAIMNQVSSLARKYRNELEQIAVEIQPLKQKWASELKEIRQQNDSVSTNKFDHSISMGQIEHWFSPIPFLLLEP